MSGMRMFVNVAAMIIIMGVGVTTWSIMVPDEENQKEQLKHLPVSHPARMEEAKKRSALVMQVLKEASETNSNTASGIGGPDK